MTWSMFCLMIPQWIISSMGRIWNIIVREYMDHSIILKFTRELRLIHTFEFSFCSIV